MKYIGIEFYGLKSNTASEVGNYSKKAVIPKECNIWSYEEFKALISVVDKTLTRKKENNKDVVNSSRPQSLIIKLK